jgi:hypothetical protein
MPVVRELKTANLHILHIISIIFKMAPWPFISLNISPFLTLLVTFVAPGCKSEVEVWELQH